MTIWKGGSSQEYFIGGQKLNGRFVGGNNLLGDVGPIVDIVAPTVTISTSGATASSINATGTVDNDGGEAINYFRFYYSTTFNVGTFDSATGTYPGATAITNISVSGNTYTASIFGLSENTNYYVAFVAGNSAGFSTSGASSISTIDDTPPPPPPPPPVTYNGQWVNQGGSYRDETIISTGDTCVPLVTSASCGTTSETCTVNGVTTAVKDFSNYMIDQRFSCVSSEGGTVADSFCSGQSGIGNTRTIDLGYGAEQGAESATPCTTTLPNQSYEQPITYTTYNEIDFSTLTGGEQINVQNTGACTVPAGQQTGCDVSLQTCPTDNGTRTITYDVTATFADRVYSCRRDTDGADVHYSFCGLTFEQSQGINEQVSPAQTGVEGSTSCSTNYANPDYDPGSLGNCVTYSVTNTGTSPYILQYTQCDSGVTTVQQFFGANNSLSAIEGTINVLGGSGYYN